MTMVSVEKLASAFKMAATVRTYSNLERATLRSLTSSFKVTLSFLACVGRESNPRTRREMVYSHRALTSCIPTLGTPNGI